MPNGTWQRVTIKNKQNLLIEGAGRGREGRRKIDPFKVPPTIDVFQ